MIDLIGGEMPAFTEDRPAAGGALLTHLVGRLPAGASVLVAGPHTGELIDALAARTDVTCLVRSQPEAIALDARGRRVRCGSLARLPATGQYDIVVALDGLDRLCSVEGPQYDWSESLEALTRVLRPGGTLLLAVENDLGVHRLVDPATPTSAQTDSAWLALGEFDTRPGTPTTLAERLAGQGLAVDWLGAAWPLPAAPTLIATPNALRDGPIDALAAAAAGAVGRAYADRSVLSDPRRLAATAVRAGLGAGTGRRLDRRRAPGPPPGGHPAPAAGAAARRRADHRPGRPVDPAGRRPAAGRPAAGGTAARRLPAARPADGAPAAHRLDGGATHRHRRQRGAAPRHVRRARPHRRPRSRTPSAGSRARCSTADAHPWPAATDAGNADRDPARRRRPARDRSRPAHR